VINAAIIRIENQMLGPYTDRDISHHKAFLNVNFADGAITGVRHINHRRVISKDRIVRHGTGWNKRRECQRFQINNGDTVANWMSCNCISPIW